MSYDQWKARQDNGKVLLVYVPVGTSPEKLPALPPKSPDKKWEFGGEVQEQAMKLDDAELQQAKLFIEKLGHFYQRDTTP